MVPGEASIDALLCGLHLGMLQYEIAVGENHERRWNGWLDSLGIPADDRTDLRSLAGRIHEKVVGMRATLGGDCYQLPMFVIGHMLIQVVANTALKLPREDAISVLGVAVADLGLGVTREGIGELVDGIVSPTTPEDGAEASVSHEDLVRWVGELVQRILELWGQAERARADGLPDLSIGRIASWSCFISYSHDDEGFARALYEALREHGIRVWFAPEAMIGDRLDRQIRDAIWRQDKLIVVLSQASVRSEWVRSECTWARARERETGEPILVPIRIDSAVDAETWLAAVLGEKRDVLDFEGYADEERFAAAVDALARS